MVKREELILYTLYISEKKIPYEIAEYIITFYYTWVFKTKEELEKAVSKYDNGKYGDSNFWDVSNVKNMTQMFWRSEIDCDISYWDVSNVKEMDNIFLYSLIQIPKWYAYNTH